MRTFLLVVGGVVDETREPGSAVGGVGDGSVVVHALVPGVGDRRLLPGPAPAHLLAARVGDLRRLERPVVLLVPVRRSGHTGVRNLERLVVEPVGGLRRTLVHDELGLALVPVIGLHVRGVDDPLLLHPVIGLHVKGVWNGLGMRDMGYVQQETRTEGRNRC